MATSPDVDTHTHTHTHTHTLPSVSCHWQIHLRGSRKSLSYKGWYGLGVFKMQTVRTVDVVDCSFLFCFSKHNKTAVQIKEDMKRMVQLPMIKPSPATATGGKKIFGVSLLELRDLGLVKDGVPVVVWSMVEYLEKHGKCSWSRLVWESWSGDTDKELKVTWVFLWWTIIML